MSLILYRFNTDGSFDLTFGNGGNVKNAYHKLNSFPKKIFLQQNGGIILSGYSLPGKGPYGANQFLMLAKYSSTGKADSMFGQNGVIDSILPYFYVSRLKVISPDKMLIVEENGPVALLTFKGKVDTIYRVKPFTRLTATIYSTINEDTTLSFIGTLNHNDNNVSDSIIFSKKKLTGETDSTFGTVGYKYFNCSHRLSGSLLYAIQSDGKILLMIRTDSTYLLRFLPGGTIDSNFSHFGAYNLPWDNPWYITAIASQHDDKIVLLNHYQRPPRDKLTIFRLSDGQKELDTVANTKNEAFVLSPNPIFQHAKLCYDLYKDEFLSIKLYNTMGQIVKEILHEQYRLTGHYEETINLGESIPAGNYTLQVKKSGVYNNMKITVL